MAKSRIVNIVATECPTAEEAVFNKWYNDIHIPMLMKFKGIKKVTRYKVMEDVKEKCRFLAVYEYDSKEEMAALNASPEFKAAIDEMNGTWKDKKYALTWAMGCEPIKTWGK